MLGSNLRWAILTKDFCGIPQSLKKCWDNTSVRPQLRPSRFCSLLYHLSYHSISYNKENKKKMAFLICGLPSAVLIPFYVRFEVFTAVTMKNGVFWVVTPRATRRNNPEDTILDTF
jgi:hypothetical protein